MTAKKTTLVPVDRIQQQRTLLERAEQYLERNKFAQAGQLVNEILVNLGELLIEYGEAEEELLLFQKVFSLAESLNEKKVVRTTQNDSAGQGQLDDTNRAYKKRKDHFTGDATAAEQDHEAEIYKLKSRYLERVMKVQQEELSNKALLLVRQSEMIHNLQRDLDGIVRRADSAENAIRAIREKLRDIPEQLMNWEKFNEDFHKVHPDFERHLIKEYPSLSKAEIKVSCLLRIGMNTREISTLLFLSERTVEIHRQHIRKKMIIPAKTEIHSVLSAL